MILDQIATFEELETVWSLDDVMRANALIDMRIDLAEVERRKQAQKHDGSKRVSH